MASVHSRASTLSVLAFAAAFLACSASLLYAVQAALPTASMQLDDTPTVEVRTVRPTSFNTLPLPSSYAIDQASVVVIVDGVLLPRSQYWFDPSTNQVYLRTQLPPNAQVQVRFRRTGTRTAATDQSLGGVNIVGGPPIISSTEVTDPVRIAGSSPLRTGVDPVVLVSHSAQSLDNAQNIQVFYSDVPPPTLVEDSRQYGEKTPVLRQERGLAISGLRTGSLTVDAGVLETASAPRPASAKREAALRALMQQAGSDFNFAAAEKRGAARWTRVQIGEKGDFLRAHYTVVSVDDDFAPVSQKSAQGATAAVKALGFMGKTDLFDSRRERKKITDLAGVTVRDWGFELEPFQGLVWSQNRREQEQDAGDALATVDTRRASFARGETALSWTQTTRRVQTGRLSRLAQPEQNGEPSASQAASARGKKKSQYSSTVQVTETWAASQAFDLPGGKARAVYSKTTFSARDEVSGEESPTRTQTTYGLQNVALLPGLNLGYSKTTVRSEDEDKPATTRTDYKLNELSLGDVVKLTGSLRRDEVEDKGLKRELLKLGLAPQSAVSLTGNLRLTTAQFERQRDGSGAESRKTNLGLGANLLGFKATLAYTRRESLIPDDDSDGTSSEPTESEQKTTIFRLTRELWSGFTASWTQTQTHADGELVRQVRGLSVQQNIGPLNIHAARVEVTDANNYVVPENRYGVQLREKGDRGAQLNVEIIERGLPPVVGKQAQPGSIPQVTKIARLRLPIGPFQLTASYDLNPLLKNGKKQQLVHGESLQYGLSVQVGPATVSGQRGKNPIVGDSRQKQSNIDFTRYRLDLKVGDRGRVHVTHERRRDRHSEITTSRWIAGASYQAGDRTRLTFDYYHNVADDDVRDVPLGEGYRLSLLHALDADTTVALHLVNPLDGVDSLHRGMPDRYTRALVQVDHIF